MRSIGSVKLERCATHRWSTASKLVNKVGVASRLRKRPVRENKLVEKDCEDPEQRDPFRFQRLLDAIGRVKPQNKQRQAALATQNQPPKGHRHPRRSSTLAIAERYETVIITVTKWRKSQTIPVSYGTNQTANTSAIKKRRFTTQKNKRTIKKHQPNKEEDASDSDIEDGDGNGRQPSGKPKDKDDLPDGCFWACPFYLFDPDRHYRCLEKYKLRRVHDVRLHIERCHVRRLGKDLYDCPNCWTEWGVREQDKHDEHVRRGDCRTIPGPERLEVPELSVLDNIPRLPGRQKWFWIWGKLFEGHAPPASPFVLNGVEEPKRLLRPRANLALRQNLASIMQMDDPVQGILDAVFNAQPVMPQRFRRFPNYVAPDASTANSSRAVQEAEPQRTAFSSSLIDLPINFPANAAGNAPINSHTTSSLPSYSTNMNPWDTTTTIQPEAPHTDAAQAYPSEPLQGDALYTPSQYDLPSTQDAGGQTDYELLLALMGDNYDKTFHGPA